MHFMDSIFIFGLMLVLFGPKKLPEIARQAGKLMMEFRRASNEFKMQMEDELRAAEQADRQKKLEAETQAAVALAASALPPATSPDESTQPGDSQEHSIMPPTVGETVAATPPNRYRVDAEAAYSEAAYADASSSAQLTQEDSPQLTQEDNFRTEAYAAPSEVDVDEKQEIPASTATSNAGIGSPSEQADGAEGKTNLVEASSLPEIPEPVTEKLPATETYIHNAPMAESDQAPIHHG
jgi:TatA/E family protein of Tat protein translocase